MLQLLSLVLIFVVFNMFEVISSNALEHLAGEEHWKRVKGFMWKYGGGMDLVDSFRITEVDHAKVHSKSIEEFFKNC